MQGAPSWVDRNGGRPPRVNQWNISVQREIFKDLVVEAAYRWQPFGLAEQRRWSEATLPAPLPTWSTTTR